MKSITSASKLILTVVFLSGTTALNAQTLKVDLGYATPAQPLQSGWTAWSVGESGTSSDDDQTPSIVFTEFGGFTATFDGINGIDIRDVASAPTGTTLGDLLIDRFRENGTAQAGTVAFNLTFSGLEAGQYQWTGYHHLGVDVARGEFDMEISTDGGSSFSIAQNNIVQTDGTAVPPGGPGISQFSFTSNGADNVVLNFMVATGGGDGNVIVNGFELAAIPEAKAYSLLVGLCGFGAILYRRQRR